MEAFDYSALAGRVVFGSGTIARVAAEVEALGCSRAFVLSDPHHAAGAALRVRDVLAKRAVGLSTEAAMHTPVEVTEKVLRSRPSAGRLPGCAGRRFDTGLGKALALRIDLPQVVIPTTYAGSEATPILGQTEQGRKTTIRSAKVLPETIIYDVDLTLGLPARLSVVSGLNAIAHAVEALYAKDANPVTSMLAERGIAAIAHALPKIVRDGWDVSARSDALFGAWACGNCLGTVGMSLHHKLCHVLGGNFDLPHAETHAVILPHATAYNAQAAAGALDRIARVLGAESAAAGLFDLAAELGAPTSLRDIGLAESKLDEAAGIAVASPYWNPRPIDQAGIRALLDDAFHGRRPQN
jgi:maleylacetate reductase